MSAQKSVFNQEEGLQSYFEDLGQHGLLDAAGERRIAESAANGNSESRNELINANLRLVVKIAKGFMGTGMALQDLIQEGNIGLMTAADKFDFNRNIRFSTYAAWWIKQSIRRAIGNKLRFVRLPYRKEEALKKIQGFLSEKLQSENKITDMQEISEKTFLTKSDIVDLLPYCGQPVSMDSLIGEDNSTLHDMISNPAQNIESEFEMETLKGQINALVNSLESKEKTIVELRYALNGIEKQTLKTISIQLGISPETVRQIEIKALKKLRSQAEHILEI